MSSSRRRWQMLALAMSVLLLGGSAAAGAPHDTGAQHTAVYAGLATVQVPSVHTSRDIERHDPVAEQAVRTGAVARAQAPKPSPKPKPPPPPPAPPAQAVDIPDSCDQYSGNRATGCAMLLERGWNMAQMSCLEQLWTNESGWDHKAENPSSGAYGIPQSLPGNKMATAGSDWQTNPATQIEWGLGYIANRYGTPCGAWQFWQNNNWY